MPQPGEIRRGASESVQWDGSRWQPIEHTSAPSNDSVGSFASDLWHGATEHPLDTLGGFFKGAATGLPTAARIAQTALPFISGGASIPAQMAIGAGTQMATDLADAYAGDENAPKTFGDFMTRGASGAAIPGVLGLVGKSVNAVRNGGGLVDAAAEAGSHVPGLKTVSRLVKAARALAPEAEGAAEASSGFAGQSKGASTGKNMYFHADESLPQYGGSQGRLNDVTSTGPSASSPRVAGKAPGLSSTLNDIVDGLRTEKPNVPMGDTPSVRSVDRSNMLGSPRQAPTPSAGRTPSDAEMFNINRSAPYGEGAVLSQNLPTELRPLSLQGLEESGVPENMRPFDLDYHNVTGQAHMPDVEVLHPDESGLMNEDPADHVVQDLVDKLKTRLGDVPSSKAVSSPSNDLPASWQPFAKDTAASAPSTDLPPSLQAIDDLFGPGSQDMAGSPFQSTSGKGANNLVYDPQTPSSYLREQLAGTEDPAEKDFLAKSLRQRLRLGTSKLNLQPQ